MPTIILVRLLSARTILVLVAVLLSTVPVTLRAQGCTAANVLTSGYDNQRNGLNSNERPA